MRLSAVFIGLFAFSMIPLANASEPSQQSVEYMALGDSLPFGDNGFIPYTIEARPDPKAFVGFADYVGQMGFQGKYLNLGCPGETSASFSDINAPAIGCQIGKRDLGLKVQYEGSQLEAALGFIRQHPEMKLITLTIGGNDYFLAEIQCKEQFPEQPEAQAKCLQERSVDVIQTAAKNIGVILQKLRGAGFKGKLFLTNFYASSLTNQAALTSAVLANVAYTGAALLNRARPIDIFAAFSLKALFADGDTCNTGLLIRNPDPSSALRCDIHYSDEGARLVAKLILDQYKF